MSPGAEGAWIGTRFVASIEAASAGWAKDQVLRAGTDDTVLTKAYDLAAAAPFPQAIGDRVLGNEFTDAWHGRDNEVIARREELQARVTAASETGDVRVAPVRAWSAVGLISTIEPAGDILRWIVMEAERVLRERPGQLLR